MIWDNLAFKIQDGRQRHVGKSDISLIKCATKANEATFLTMASQI